MWRATGGIYGGIRLSLGHFNPRPPCGGRPLLPALRRENGKISIHALRVEGDPRGVRSQARQTEFQSTPSVWRATNAGKPCGACTNISIHALRVEGDAEICTAVVAVLLISIHALRVEGDYERSNQEHGTQHFNPRPPCGGRLLLFL